METLGPYVLESELGSGGMGTVYLARTAGPGNGPRVAVKVVHDHLLERRGAHERFLREARLGREVRHPNVVRTLDAGTYLRGGRPVSVLVMEYVDGSTLRGRLRERFALPEDECRRIGIELARALEAIHATGAIHRDLKPENVLLTREGSVKLTDLGVARVLDEEARLSGSDAFLGSLLYAAPEQFSAHGGADERSDLYAFGVVLFELATGVHPFCAEDLRESMRRQLDGEIPLASELNPRVSPFLELVLTTLLAEEPDRRFGSASELRRTLEEGERSAWWRRRRGAGLIGLSETESELLGLASCAGISFDARLVAEALGRDVSSVEAELAGLAGGRGILLREEGRFRFAREHVRRLVLEGQPTRLRALYHLALAQALAVLARDAPRPLGDLPGEEAAILCEGFLRGGQPERARPYVASAIEHLIRERRLDTALTLLELAGPLLAGAESG
jgi:hypothetical protein